MNNLLHQLANLSPEKRRVFEALLTAQGIDLARALIVPQPRTRNAFPLSFAQQRLWFLDQLEPGSARYNIPIAARLTGALDVRALARALNEIIRRHESLRTRFEQKNGPPAQIIAPTLALELPVDDLRAAPDREAEALRRANIEARAPFDLTRAPLARARVWQLAGDDHIILLILHHIIADGWSMRVILRELAAVYAAFVADQPLPLPELEIQYADYACWQREWLTGAMLEKQLAYWKKQLATSPAQLELPTDHARPATSTPRGAQRAFDVPRAVSAALKQLSQRENATLFMTLLSAFQVLLHRYTGQADLCIGTPIANRNRAEIEDLVGFFVNTLVLRGDLSGAPTFRELLRRTRATALDAYAHQDVPFEMLVDELHPQRDSSYTPLFQVMFALQTLADASYRLPQLTITPIPLHSGAAKFDLTFTLTEHADGVSGVIEYSADLFDDATIARMAGHYQTLLANLSANPDLPITDYPFLTSPELHQLLIEWNATRAEVPRDQCIHSLFENQVEKTPNALAVVCENATLTYRELNARANQLARFLRARGVCPDTLVALCVERSLDMLVGVLGILKAGGAYVPLDPTYPADRLAFMLEDSGAQILLTQSNLFSRFTPHASRLTIHLDSDWDTIAREDGANLVNRATPENLAYVIYTSGSTGKPKGVMIQHDAVVNLWVGLERAIYSRYPYRPRRVSFNAPLSFDASVQQWVMLLSGHTLDIIPHDIRLDGDALVKFIRAHRLDVLDCVPTQLKILLNAGLLDENEWVPAMVLPGGEAIDPATWDTLARAPHTDFYNMYGPTECTVDSTICPVRAELAPSIGRPIVNVQHFILDSQLQPMPIGVPGELHIGGAGVARGYLNRPELTAEKFITVGSQPSTVNSPLFTDNGSLRLYKTGDLARYRVDGNIEYLGRSDTQIKLRGVRIELGEIEAALRQHSAVREAVVIVREEANDARLVAYVVAHATLSGLRDYLRARLPEYMIPSAFVPLDVLPLLPNGKLDRRALPAPVQLSREDEYIAPRTPTEEMLAGIWAQVLNVARVGVHDNFFDLGGHSLLATQLISRIRNAFNVELPLRAMFETQTLAELARQIENAQRVPAPPIERIARDRTIPLSFAQQRLWVLDQLEPNNPLYNIAAAVRLEGALDADALARALNEIVQQHEALRTSFANQDGQAAQIIAPALTFDLARTDLRDAPQTDQLDLARADARLPFDLTRAPLLRARLVRIADDTHVLILVVHHIIADGWSMQILLREVIARYAARPASRIDLPIQYADYAIWQREQFKPALEEQLAYWKQKLATSSPVLDLPTDRPRPAMQTYRGALYKFELPPALGDALATLSRAEGATLFMTLLAAFQVLLSRYTGQNDFNIGAPIANRNRVEVENLIGFFVNTLVLRADLTGAPTFRELLKRTRATTLDAHAHQDAPFEWLVSALAPERDLSYSPLFQVLFDLDRAPITQIQLGDVIATPLDLDPGTAKFDLALVMAQDARGLRGSLEYNTDLFDAATIARLVKNFETLLTSIVANPELPITNYQFLAQTERDQLIAWNTTAADFPRDQCIHQLFENQVARMPDQIAVMFENETLTYRELNARANRLAHYLRKLGAQPETLIAICIERSLDTLVAMLGALKAGGAYVPLDPDYPSDRLAFMLEDSGAPIVVAQSHLAEAFRNSQFAIRNLICLDSDWDTIAREDDANPLNTTTPENLAYVIYTSGSTGEPKGVLIEHRGVCNLATAYIREFAITPRSRVLQFFSFSFDGSVADIFTALLAGATLCLPSRDNALPGPAFADWLREKEITFGVFVPAALAVMEPEKLPRLEVVISAGETCPPEIAEHWRNGRRFYNAYGPTEATVAACWYAVTTRVASNVPIGRPFVNVQLHILDEQHQPVPIGARGELCIGGVGVARGYLNRPELTAEKFITVGSQPSTVNSPPLPVHGSLFTDNGSLRLYRTGDLARFLSDGNVEFLGRMDQQVKVRGFRIELGEIETALEQHPAIQHAAVIAREDDGIKRIVAYVTARENLEGLNLREFLRARLPEYMLPARFVPLDTLPRLPNGKVDRRALPAPIQSARARAYIAPRTRAEEILARVWAEVLRVERVSVDDNFFELGGDSILAIQVIARAHHAGLALTPKQLFQTPTIAELARVAATARARRAGQASVTGDVPLTPIQHWFFEQNLVEPHHWNQAVRVQMREPLERAAFEKTFAAILAHHDALRTRFTRDDADAGWRAYIADTHDAMPFEWIDLRAETDRALETRIAALQASLNLADGSLARAAYFDFGAARAGQLFIAIHHLAVDNVSWRILLEDLVTAYASARRGEPIALPPKTTAFQHWATRLNEHAQTDAARAEIAFWVDALNGGAPALPQDARGENSEASAQRITLEFAATAARADIADVLLTALSRAGARWTNAPALRVDLEGHGRADLFDDVDVSRTVGWFTNVYPMRFAINPRAQPSESLRAIKAQLRRVPNRGIGFGLLRYLRRDTHALMAALPRAQISFNYLGRLDSILPASAPFEFVRASNGFEHSPRARRPYWIEIAAGIFGDALQVEWTYSANLHHRATIERVARDFAEQVRALLAADARDYRLSDFDVALSQAELDALVAETSAA